MAFNAKAGGNGRGNGDSMQMEQGMDSANGSNAETGTSVIRSMETTHKSVLMLRSKIAIVGDATVSGLTTVIIIHLLQVHFLSVFFLPCFLALLTASMARVSFILCIALCSCRWGKLR